MQVPRPFRQTSPTQVALREGGGRLSIFVGLSLVLAGSAIVRAFDGVPARSDLSALPWVDLSIEAAGVVALGVGGCLVFGRRWTIFDTASGRVTRRYGLFFPMCGHERMLDEFSGVVMTHEGGGENSRDRYLVCLRAIDGKDLEIWSLRDFGE